MAERKKPKTEEELQADVEQHPDRGIINGKKVIDDSRREIRGTISAESKRKFLRVISCYGVGMNEGLQMAVSALWRQEQAIVQNHEEEKATEFGVTQREIQIKEFGHHKARGRAKRLNLTGGENEQNSIS